MHELIDLTLAPADIAGIQTLLTSLEEAMPFLVGLSADRVKALFKLGPRSEAFVMKALVAAELHPELLPRNSPLPAMQRDAALRAALHPIRTRVATLLELLDGTMMLAGADLMKNASAVYRVLQIQGESRGLDDLLEDMGQRFAKRRKPAPAVPVAPAAAPTPAEVAVPSLHPEPSASHQRPVPRGQPGNAWLQPGIGGGYTDGAGSGERPVRTTPPAPHLARSVSGIGGTPHAPSAPCGHWPDGGKSAFPPLQQPSL